MMVLIVKMLGVCPIYKKSILHNVGENHYKCDKCGAILRAKIAWKVVKK